LTIPTVTIDNIGGTHTAMEHLIVRCGRRQIAFLQGLPGNEDSDWREMAYRQALATHGLTFDPTLVARGDYTEAGAVRAIEQWLTVGTTFDALFTGDDFAAMGAILALRKAGIDVPQQVSVVGFDDVDVARHFNPPLTTVRSPIEEAGHWAAELLIQLIRTGVAESVVLPTELVVRQSCGSLSMTHH
jgi:DNA-binding LacI/PurR family transcriptional regulator